MVSTRPPPSKSFKPFNNPLVTVPKAPIKIRIIVTFMFHSFFYIFQSYSVVTRDSQVDNFADSFYYYNVWSSDRNKVIRVYVKVP